MKKRLLTLSYVVLIFAIIGLGVCFWKLYVLEKALFILLGGIFFTLLVATNLNIITKYILTEKDIK